MPPLDRFQIVARSPAISATHPGPGEMENPRPCSFAMAATRLRPRPSPGVTAAFIGTVEASPDEIAFGRSDAGSAVTDAYDALVPHASKAHLDAAAFRCEFHGIVDEIGNGLEQEVTVAPHDHVLLRSDRENHSLVLTNGLVELAGLAHEICQRHRAKGGQTAAVRDFGDPQ
jgi:hypothetical protein